MEARYVEHVSDATAPPASAPAHWEADVVLRDGRTVRIRPITANDGEALASFHRSLSDQTVDFRFFAPYPELSQRDVDRFSQVDHVDRVALVATVGGELVGVARYDRLDETDAEVAFVVRDDHQGRGLGSVLLEHLAAAARERDVRRFVAEVLPSNRRMLATFEEAGYHPSHRIEDGVVVLSFDIAPSHSSERVRVAREHRAEARSVAALVAPKSVVIVGAGRDTASLGHQMLRHLMDSGFTGRIYVVNRVAAAQGATVLGVPTYARVRDIAESVDLAVVAVPVEEVSGVVDDCAAIGVAGLLVVSSGFAESGPEGLARQRALVRRARGNGMRVIGPNALGIVNTDPLVQLNASLAPSMPRRAPIGFFCQSGALGGTILARAHRRGLGVSTFVSAGNRADISGNDLLQFWEDDTSTDVVLLYLESLGNPRKFTRIARRLSRSKPVVAMRTGRSTQSYPLGHSVRRTTLPVAAVDSIFAQAGVIETDSLGQLFDVAGLLAFQPLPQGSRVAVVGNSDALAVLTTDACESSGLSVVGAPVTLRQDCDVDTFARSIREVLGDDHVDSLVITHVPMLGVPGQPWERAISAAATGATKPVVAVLVAARDESGLIAPQPGSVDPAPGSVPFYGTVEEAVMALSRVTRYAQWRARPLGEIPDFADLRREEAAAVVLEVLGSSDVGHAERDAQGEDGVELRAQDPADQLSRILAAYGIEVWPGSPVASEDEAVAASETVGYPVVLKTLDIRFASRTDLGGLRLNLDNQSAVRNAYASMAASLDPDAAANLVVQGMAPPGVACVVGSVEDALFGPVVSFGLSGVVPELLGDRGYRIPPLTDADARDLVAAPGASPVLDGVGGSTTADRDALENLVLRVGLLADDLPEVGDLVLEPVVVSASGLVVLGARAVLRHPAARTDSRARRLGT